MGVPSNTPKNTLQLQNLGLFEFINLLPSFTTFPSHKTRYEIVPYEYHPI